MSSSRKSVTIGDVARAAGVSRATASRALNESDLVTDATKERVQAAVIRTGFVANAQARGLAIGRAQAIAVLITEQLDELLTDPTHGAVLRGINDRLAQTPYLPMLLQAYTEAEHARALRHFSRRSVDAVISLTPYVGGEMLSALASGPLPVVLCGQLEGRPYEGTFSTVYSDDIEGAELAAQRMSSRGRGRVGVILGPADNPASLDRLRGYRQVFGEQFADDAVVFTGWDSDSGFAAAWELLDRVPGLDGILAGSDRIAAGALQALRRAGRSVPEEVSVIGFDDHQIATTTVPPLTTVAQPLLYEGGLAASMALDMIDGAPPRTEVLQMSLVQRESC